MEQVEDLVSRKSVSDSNSELEKSYDKNCSENVILKEITQTW